MTTQEIKVGNITIGGPAIVLIAGPCSIESADHWRETATEMKKLGAHALRGGIHKLRTSPGSFQGPGHEAYGYVKKIKNDLSMPLFAEVTDPRQIAELIDTVDAFQVGARNMYNYELLKELGRQSKPVLLKRGFSGLIDEWLKAADYVCQPGYSQVILCERGIRTFETATRNTLDLNAVAYIKAHTHYAVIVDPSHGTGRSELVGPMARAGLAAGADGLMIESHFHPDKALSDGFQALRPQELNNWIVEFKKIAQAMGRTWNECGA